MSKKRTPAKNVTKAAVKVTETAVKEEVKAPVVEVEAPAKVEEAPAKVEEKAENVEAPAKTEEKKAEPKKATKSTKTTAKKAVKEELKAEVFIQYQDKEAIVADAVEKAKAQYVADGHRVSSIKSLRIYLKPEEYAAYYVINEKFAGRVDLF